MFFFFFYVVRFEVKLSPACIFFLYFLNSEFRKYHTPKTRGRNFNNISINTDNIEWKKKIKNIYNNLCSIFAIPTDGIFHNRNTHIPTKR